LPSRYGFGFTGARTSEEELAQAIGAEAENSTFSNVLRFLGRPGFALRALLAGDPLAAGKNLGQMALDLPTGGFIDRRLSLANLIDEDGDLTERKDQLEFTDLLHRWGGSHPAAYGYGAKLALDIIGGTLTDPLTLLEGAGAARSIGKGAASALRGANRITAQRAAASALKATPEGSKLLARTQGEVLQGLVQQGARLPRAGVDQTAADALRARMAALVPADELPKTALRRRLAAQPLETLKENPLGLSRTADPVQAQRRLGMIQRGLEQRAAERIFWNALEENAPEEAAKVGRMLADADAGWRNMGARVAKATDDTDPSFAPFERGRTLAPGVFRRGRFSTAPVMNRLEGQSTEATRALDEIDAGARQTLYDGLDEGTRHLERMGLVKDPTALYWRVPWTQTGGMITQNFWSKVGRFGTAPGWVREASRLTDTTRPVADLMDAAFLKIQDWGARLYDKTLMMPGAVSEAVRHAWREKAGIQASENVKSMRRVQGAAGVFSDAENEEIGKVLSEAEKEWLDLERRGVAPLPPPAAPPNPHELARTAWREVGDTLDEMFPDGEDDVVHLWEQIMRNGDASADDLSEAVRDIRDTLEQSGNGELARHLEPLERALSGAPAEPPIDSWTLRALEAVAADPSKIPNITKGQKRAAEAVGDLVGARRLANYAVSQERARAAAAAESAVQINTEADRLAALIRRHPAGPAMREIAETEETFRQASQEVATLRGDVANMRGDIERIEEFTRRAQPRMRTQGLAGLHHKEWNFETEWQRLQRTLSPQTGAMLRQSDMAMRDVNAQLDAIGHDPLHFMHPHLVERQNANSLPGILERLRTAVDDRTRNLDEAHRNVTYYRERLDHLYGRIAHLTPAQRTEMRSLVAQLDELQAQGRAAHQTAEAAQQGAASMSADLEAQLASIAHQAVAKLDPKAYRQIWIAGATRGMIEEATQRVAAARGAPPDPTLRGQVERLFGDYLDDMQRIPPELKRLEVWSHDAGNPFYFPHQLDSLFQELISESLRVPDMRGAIQDVFTQFREHRNIDDFREALLGIAKKFGVDVDGMEVVDFHLGRLWLRRMTAHHQTVARAGIVQEAKRLGMKPGDSLDQYLRAQWEPVGLRQDVLSKILGGGEFRVRVTPALREWAKYGNDDRAHAKTLIERRLLKDKNGQEWIKIQWPGLNKFWKPMLTSQPQNLGFHVRNLVSATFMGLFDEDLGFTGVKAAWETMRNASNVATFGKLGYSGSDLSNVVKLFADDAATRAKALEELNATGKRVGTYTWPEVASILDRTLGPRVSQSDLMQRLGHIDALGREIFLPATAPGLAPQVRMARAFRRWTKIGEDMASSLETTFRSNAMLQLLAKGVDATEAIRRVNRAFVNYNVNSVTERFLRDTIPFARFTIGSSVWLKTMAEKPRVLNWMGRLQGSARGMQEEDLWLPERAEDSLAVPLPWKDKDGNLMFLLGLGLPMETSLQVLGMATPRGFRRGVLGGMHPVLRVPAEAVTNRSFYFGGEFGEYRKAPAWIREAGLADEITLPDGTKRWEISGSANEILNALPTSRMDSMLNKLLDDNRPKWDALINVTTGVRTVTVDMRTELRKRVEQYLKAKVASGEVGETLIYFNRLDPETTPEDLKIVLQGLADLRAEGRRRR
jgi:hypothetical protein